VDPLDAGLVAELVQGSPADGPEATELFPDEEEQIFP
jgi:hypothetical protein